MSNCENNCTGCDCDKLLYSALNKITELEAKLNPPQPKLTPEDLEKKKKEVAFFTELKRGAGFIKFILDDLHRGNFNRAQRRRLISQMMNKKFSMELISIYLSRVEEVITYLNGEINSNAPVDGEEYFNKMKELETKNDV